MSSQTASRLVALQSMLACEMAELYVRSYSLDTLSTGSGGPWRDTQASPNECPEEKKVMSLAKEYLLLTGMLEVHPSEPDWVRVLPGPISSQHITDL